MNNGKVLTLMEKIRLQQEQAIKAQELQKKKRERQRILRRRRRVAVVVLASLMVTFIYGMNLLFNDNSKSYAIEAPIEEKTTKEAPQKEINVEQKEQKVLPVTTEVSSTVETTPSKPSVYNENIPMPKEHQEYLYELCEERGLDYHKTLAVIQHESKFNPNALNETNDYGYFQVNAVNHADLAKKLHTDNSAFNPYINMNWGTYMLADLYSYWGEKGFTGSTLDEVVWSSYNKGITGFKENGHATAYVYKMKASIQEIDEKF
ncbi:hypothetical protein CVD28_00145 [Bacillus sp. M6-12]|uniref:transglycosylase SLT domain-containing protein n=1 Tax=Bacillus sp. M6-12 TaxID=2054166 RepID=UPI000C7703A3|nr:transglycosylase SLT domain-containing protein [Bacillus sp. M6-12]PLS18846.1 hypothetical protein CVD28_00145 [Bacillus sp. M6-12]